MERPIIVKNWLTGDIGIERNAPARHKARFRRLKVRLARAARNSRQKWHVNSGYRSYAEQAALYDKYLHHGGNLAAKPGQSNHNHGEACDVSAPDGTPVGAATARKLSLKKYGLCLPVPGEKWHVEIGDKWVAAKRP